MSQLSSRRLVLAPLAASIGLLAAACQPVSQQITTIFADSARDFSGTQGANGWSYGYWDRTADRDGVYDQATDFRLLKHFGADPVNALSTHPDFTTGDLWYLQDGRYYTSLWAAGGHPHGTMDLGRYARAEHWVVRRWVSSTDAQVAIHGRAGKVMPWGENWVGSIEFQVVAGGATVYEAVIDGGAQGYSATAAVQAGMPVDFLIGPGTGIGVVEFTGTIQAAGGNALQ